MYSEIKQFKNWTDFSLLKLHPCYTVAQNNVNKIKKVKLQKLKYNEKSLASFLRCWFVKNYSKYLFNYVSATWSYNCTA